MLVVARVSLPLTIAGHVEVVSPVEVVLALVSVHVDLILLVVSVMAL
jgi:hypothetical protein